MKVNKKVWAKIRAKLRKFALALWEELYPELKAIGHEFVSELAIWIAEAQRNDDWSGEGKLDYVRDEASKWLKDKAGAVPGFIRDTLIHLAVAELKLGG